MVARGSVGWCWSVGLDNKPRRRRHTFRCFAISSKLSRVFFASSSFSLFITSAVVQLQSLSLVFLYFFLSFFWWGKFFLHARCCVWRAARRVFFPTRGIVGGVWKVLGLGGSCISTTRRLLRDDADDDGVDDEDDGGLRGDDELTQQQQTNHNEHGLKSLSSTGNSNDSWWCWCFWLLWNSRNTPVSPNSGSS